MNKLIQSFRYLIISAIACLLTVGLSTFSQPAHSYQTTNLSAAQPAQTSLETLQAKNYLTAQTMMNDRTATRFAVMLSKDEVLPMAPSSNASGVADAILTGDRLMVRGNFMNLSSPLRNYVIDPLDPPNPNITSAVHIHQGEPTANGPFQYALQVSPDASGLQGQFTGEYTLTPAQRQALMDGKLYMDLHTQQNRAGELRGMFKPY